MIREDLIRALSNPTMKVTDRALLKRMHTNRFKEYVEDLTQLLSFEQPSSAPCLYHGGCCCITPPGLCREDVLWIDCGSPSCTAWSARGKRLGWLDVTNIPTILWAYFLSKEGLKPDIVFGENVPGFDLEWWKSLSPAY